MGVRRAFHRVRSVDIMSEPPVEEISSAADFQWRWLGQGTVERNLGIVV
jgi:hypothetical protein